MTVTAKVGKLDPHSISLSCSLQPYASCLHSRAFLSQQPVSHLEGLVLTVAGRDTDNMPITRTEFEFRVRLQDEAEATLHRGGNGNDTVVHVPSSRVSRERQYTVTVELVDGWNHDTWTHGRCTIASMTASVKCSGGFHADSSTNQCTETVLPCPHFDRQQSAGIGSASSELAVSVRPNQGADQEPEITLHPSSTTFRVPVTLKQEWVGNFSVRMRAHACVRMRACTCVRAHACVRMRACACLHAYVCVRAWALVFVDLRTRMCVSAGANRELDLAIRAG